MTDEPRPRPTTMLHDAWGPSRPATDAELAQVQRMDTRLNVIVATLLVLALGGFVVFVLWLASRLAFGP